MGQSRRFCRLGLPCVAACAHDCPFAPPAHDDCVVGESSCAQVWSVWRGKVFPHLWLQLQTSLPSAKWQNQRWR
eukprot:3599140-Amphidinium_carterae.1